MTDASGAADTEEIERIISAALTTSAKIRALGERGLSRTQIRDLLGIRYQHVRKVLIDAGIDAASPYRANSAASSLPEPAAPPAQPPLHWRDLLSLGFVEIGHWGLSEAGIVLDGVPPNEPGVYAFILDDSIAYVGLTQNTLRARMGHYRLGHVRQKTSARVNMLIREALANGSKVHVLMCLPGSIDWNGLTLQLAPSLEAALIGRIRPDWNIQGNRRGS